MDNNTLADPEVYRNDLVRAVLYSDSTDSFTPPATGYSGSITGTDHVAYTYDRQGEVTSMTDQNATTHTYSYDNLGRETADSVTQYTGGAVDPSVLRIGYGYDQHGLLASVTSYSSASGGTTNVVNDVQMQYNDMGEVTKEYQEHNNTAVNTATSLYVQYNYAGASDEATTG